MCSIVTGSDGQLGALQRKACLIVIMEMIGLRVRVDLVLCVQYCTMNSVHSRGGWTVGALQRKACLIVIDQPCEMVG